MPTDSTELTFVRCPSCRSLVPAMSTRCRMCGATLEAVGKDETRGNDAQKQQQARVRQRTMSQPDEALESGLEDIHESKGAQTPPLSPVAPQKSKDIAHDDPLRDFLEEIPLEEEAQSKSKPEQGKNNTPKKSDLEDSRVIIESGRGSKSDGLSFGKGKTEPKKEERPQPAPRPQPQEVQREEKKAASPPPPPPPQHNREQRDLRPPKRDEREAAQFNRETKPSRPAEKQAARTQQGGRLFGWLVSYDDPNGSAIEIREGKFFVSRERLKPNDLVVDHESISTPHAVLVTEVGSGLHIQDLMSDHGLFVKKRGSSEYEKQEDRVSVSHGDWLRFGEVEFLVSLVAHVGAK